MQTASATFTKPRQTFTSGSGNSTNQQAIYAAERARILFGAYRRGDANDPDTYVAAIAAVLALYAPSLIKLVTDPRTGISTTEKFRTFMPNSGELKAYCDEQQAIMDRHRRYAELPKPDYSGHDREPVCVANLLVIKDSPRYRAIVDRSEKSDVQDWKWDERGRGIWVPLSWW